MGMDGNLKMWSVALALLTVFIFKTSHAFEQVFGVNGGYGQWSEFSKCSATCGSGIRARVRKCDNPPPENEGCDCESYGPSVESQECKIRECPVDGGFTQWSTFTTCSVTCGGGFRSRSRTCTNPKPAHGGADCVGENEEYERCRTNPCPVDGAYGQWTAFSFCSTTCGGGVKTRTRECNNPAPVHGGHPCQGGAYEEVACQNDKKCPVIPKWSSWGSYGECSKTCGGGQKSRRRVCKNICENTFSTPTCQGSRTGSIKCNTQPCLGPTSCRTLTSNHVNADTPIKLTHLVVHCPRGQVLNSLRLKRNDQKTLMQYEYRCCTSRIPCTNEKTANWYTDSDREDGNTRFLDQQEITCFNSPSGGVSYLKLNINEQERTWAYSYDCCYPKFKVSCHTTQTSYKENCEKDPGCLDQHYLSCSRGDNYFISRIILMENSSHTKFKYEYRCCRIQPPRVEN